MEWIRRLLRNRSFQFKVFCVFPICSVEVVFRSSRIESGASSGPGCVVHLSRYFLFLYFDGWIIQGSMENTLSSIQTIHQLLLFYLIQI